MHQITKLNKFFDTHPLTKSHKIAAWTRFLSWQLRSRLQKEVIVDWIGGQRLCVKRGMTGATGNIYAGLHEFTDMIFLMHFLQKDDLFIDVGANVGSYTILAAGVSRSKVWSFEPDPQTFEYLKRNIAINDLQDNVRSLNCALGDMDGYVNFTIGLDTVNHIAGVHEKNTRSVEISKLDSLVGQSDPIMMKIDVEGHEPATLRGAESTLKKNSLMAIQIETVTTEISDLLAGSGFNRAYYDPFRRELSNFNCSLESANQLFIRNIDYVSARLKNAPTINVLHMSV